MTPTNVPAYAVINRAASSLTCCLARGDIAVQKSMSFPPLWPKAQVRASKITRFLTIELIKATSASRERFRAGRELV